MCARTHFVAIVLALFCAALLAENSERTSPIQSVLRENLHPKIVESSPTWCDVYEACGDLVRVDCRSSLDGIERYFNRVNGELIMNCGGRCMNPQPDDPMDCKACPPAEWAKCSASPP